MCGIAGIVGVESRKSVPLIKKMVSTMSHRGPDANGTWTNRSTTLGHARLSIIDLSPDSNQPMIDSSGRYTIVYNGEIYNFKEIKSMINDFPFKTKSDTEVILAAFIKWGKDCIKIFNGMFAFAIWDNITQQMFIARDRMGIKPLYYYCKDGILVFSSELRALMKSGLIPKKLNYESIVDFLSNQCVQAPFTILKDVLQIMPGQTALWDNGVLQKETYWGIDEIKKASEGDSGNDPERIKAKIAELMKKSVERRLLSDVPLGAFLSGGIDSSAIVALMAEVSSQKIQTFSIGFKEKGYDESVYASSIAKKYKTDHTLLTLKPNDFLNDIDDALDAMDSPSGDGMNTYTISRITRQAGIIVAISGLGGDELFAGYDQFRLYSRLTNEKLFWNTPLVLRQLAAMGMNGLPATHKSDRIQQILRLRHFSMSKVYPVFRQVMSKNEIKGLVSPFSDKGLCRVEGLFTNNEELINTLPILSQVSWGELRSYTLNLLLKDSDQMSMASSLELRVPFFDHELVEYVLSVPDRIKYPKYPKKLLIESLDPRIPDEIVHRKKMGFSFPWDQWIRNELYGLCEKSLENLCRREWINEKKLMKTWNQFLKKDPKITWIKIWLLVVLEEWIKKNIDESN